MCVPTRNEFDHEGYVEEERARHKKQEREAAVSGQTQIKLERIPERKTEGEHKR